MAQSSTAAAAPKKAGPSAGAGGSAGQPTVTKLQLDIHNKLKQAKGSRMVEDHLISSFSDVAAVKNVKMSIAGLLKMKLVALTMEGDVRVFHWKDPKSIRASATNTPEMNLCLMKIREMGNKGISAKSLRHHLGQETSQPALRKALEALEKSGQIDQFKSIHQPTLPLFIIHDLRPSKDLLGGIWYDGNKEYDAGLVDGVCKFLLNKVREHSLPGKSHKRSTEAKKLVHHPVFVASRTPTFLTPNRLVQMVKAAKLTAEKIGTKEVMECMRALDLDGLVVFVKPMGGTIDDAAPLADDDGDDGPAAKRRKGNDEEPIDEEAEERAALRRKEKEKRAKKKEKERREKAKAKKKKEKKRQKKKEKKKKEKERAKRKAKKSKKRKDDSDSDSDDVEAEDSDALVDVNDEDASKSKKKSKKSSSKKRRRRSSSSSDSDSDSDSDDSDSDSDSSSDDSDSDSDSDDDSASDSDDSSADSDNLDDGNFDGPKKRKKDNRMVDLVVVQDSVFGAADINNLDDEQVVYRATSRYKMPLAQDQVPCGRCPQFAFCEGDGPVNPDDCPYFEDWLANDESGWDIDAKKKYGLLKDEKPTEAEMDGLGGEGGVAQMNGHDDLDDVGHDDEEMDEGDE